MIKDNWEYIQDFCCDFGRLPKDADELDYLISYVDNAKRRDMDDDLEKLASTYLNEHRHDVLLCPHNGLTEFGKLVAQWQREKDEKSKIQEMQDLLELQAKHAKGDFKESIVKKINEKIDDLDPYDRIEAGLISGLERALDIIDSL